MSTKKPVILHIGDPIKHNPEVYERFASEFTVIRPEAEERQREPFLQALRDRKWGDFDAVFRPFWNTGGEMGRWDKELIPLLPKSMKIYASAGAGYDWADVDILAEHGILYCNGARASSEAVADMAIFHILSVFRNLAWSQLAARSGDPAQWTEAHKHATATSHNPQNHILGIIGLGNIGTVIARKAFACFGMKIHYFDVERKTASHEAEAGNAVFEATLDDLLGVSDCVVLATPFGGSVLIDSARLTKFKHGSRFVNIARGTLVDEDALVAALKSGQLHAAGLDVFANEPRVHPELCKMNNVTLTCHNAGGAIETNFGFERLAMENIEAFLLQGKALTPVNAHLIKG
ncbi:uncharacterized protein GGS22DRAFT_79985 [Annulohypoxylon maeteangense]|uniref:uncharacterized protein n=1 Tax=Annulohypoxylon maeteangense TaxID=1927788 RepID=UPI002008C750|nr:uncharacterized protein GGS22DRAFT_79985 [Annulohypoxylon maeteangense]KAI0880770.1 hypothetical protein GGS22DRAFT_79985 [Annulohypoxylon maeteangense]